MHAILLHNPGKRIAAIQKGLLPENIKVDSKIFMLYQELDPKILETNIIIIYCDSPECDILQCITALRIKRYFAPIVIIDEHENITTQKHALELGANAYFVQPLSYRLLAMQLKKLVFGKNMPNGGKWLRAFDIWLDVEQHLVKRCNKIIPLRNKEFSLLEFFIINRGKLLTRNAILDYVWDRNANFASNTVDVHINRLRRKIDDPFRDKLIHTIYCIGYIFDKKKINS